MDQTKDQAVQVIRRILTGNYVQIEQILIFGSRARGDENSQSDWDFLVLVLNPLSVNEKHKLIRMVKRELAQLGIPNDIVIQSRQQFDELKEYPGTVSRIAALEGVPA